MSFTAPLMRHSLALALVAVLALAGCRDALVADPPPAVDPPPTNAGLASLYIKGGIAELTLGRETRLRAQSNQDVVTYSWNFYDADRVEVSYVGVSPREVLVTGRIPGELIVEVFGRNGTGSVVAVGERRFTVVR